VLDGRFVLQRSTDDQRPVPPADVLALVFGPTGAPGCGATTPLRTAWAALWSGDDAHDPNATGMLSAILAPLATGKLPVWVASSYDGDLILVPWNRLDEALETLRQARHHVSR
jgi:hypothetical protein